MFLIPEAVAAAAAASAVVQNQSLYLKYTCNEALYDLYHSYVYTHNNRFYYLE